MSTDPSVQRGTVRHSHNYIEKYEHLTTLIIISKLITPEVLLRSEFFLQVKYMPNNII